MKKKIIIIIVAVVLVISSVAVYFFTKPNVTISIGKPIYDIGEGVDTNAPMYVENTRIGYGGYLSAKNKNKLSLFSTEVDRVEKEIYNNYTEPTHIEVDIKFENNQTIITYHGTATEKDTNKEIDYNEVITLDFIITKEVNEVE